MNTNKPLLEVKNLKTYFYTEDGVVRAVDGVNFEVYPGEVLGLVGESGCGKSVTSLSIMRLISRPGRIDSGEILLDGKEITGLSPDRVTKMGISRTYQNIRLFKNMTAVENILVGMHPHLKSGLIGGSSLRNFLAKIQHTDFL